MSEDRTSSAARLARTNLLDRRPATRPAGRVAGESGAALAASGAMARLPLRTRLALIRPQMLKAQPTRAGRP